MEKAQKNEKAMSIEDFAKFVALKKELLEVEKQLAEKRTAKKQTEQLTEKDKKIAWFTKRGWNYKNDVTTTKTWTDKTGISKTKEFNGVVFENSKGEQKTALWVKGGNVLKFWN